MVRGLDHFRNYFRNHSGKYILIGGTACDIAMSRMGLEFRATKDLDIVLVIEALDAEFGSLLWSYI
jgi:predicted nucleotidyltransferase